jgi:hypothetical protein
LKGSNEVSEIARERRPDESEKRVLMLPKSSETSGGRSREFEPITIDALLWRPKPLFSRNHCSTSPFKIFSSSPKANSFIVITHPWFNIGFFSLVGGADGSGSPLKSARESRQSHIFIVRVQQSNSTNRNLTRCRYISYFPGNEPSESAESDPRLCC